MILSSAHDSGMADGSERDERKRVRKGNTLNATVMLRCGRKKIFLLPPLVFGNCNETHDQEQSDGEGTFVGLAALSALLSNFQPPAPLPSHQHGPQPQPGVRPAQ